MKKIVQFVLFVVLGVVGSQAQTAAIQGYCTTGGVKVMTSGLSSTTTVQASYPKCTVTVYNTGTTTKTTIFANSSGTALSNPFTANTNASWLFYSTLGVGVDIVLSGGTPLAFPAPVTLTDIISGGGGITTSVNTLIGAVTLSQGPNITITPIGGNALQISSTGGGGGNPDGLGTAQSSTRTGGAFLSGGTINTNAENTANNGPQQTQANLCASGSTNTICSMFTPPTSTDTTVGGPLPVVTGKPSSMWQDFRFNGIANFYTNPLPSASALNAFSLQGPQQIAETKIVSYTLPFPPNYGYSQLSVQNGSVEGHIFTTGANLGPIQVPLPGYLIPATGYPNAPVGSQVYNGRTFLDNFNGMGIKQAQTFLTNSFGIGDFQTMAWFCGYSGGNIELSAEGVHCLGEIHHFTPGDVIGTIASVQDTGTTTGLMKFKVTSDRANTLGQGRYMFGSPLFGSVIADKITNAVGASNTPGTIVFNDITLPVSTARGVFATNCYIPIQMQGVAVSPSCAITVDTGFGAGHFCPVGTWDGTACTGTNVVPVCSAYHEGGLVNFGQVVISATAISGGSQNLVMTMRKGMPAGAVIYQGGGCGMGINAHADQQFTNLDASEVSGSVVPCIGTTDAHTLLCPAYLASTQSFVGILANTSHAGTRALASGATSGANALGFNVTLTRTAGITSAIADLTGFPIQYLNSQLFFFIQGCSDTTFNKLYSTFTSMPGPDPNLIQWADPQADSAGCTGALMYSVATVFDVVPIVEVYNVANNAVDGSVHPELVVDGTVWTSRNDYFATPGNAIDSPAHYAAIGDTLNLDAGASQPYGFMSGLVIAVRNNSADSSFNNITAGQAISVVYNQQAPFGFGGNLPPVPVINITSPNGTPPGWGLNFQVAPSFVEGVINVGPCSGIFGTANNTFCTYPLIQLAGSDNQLGTNTMLYNARTDTIGFGFFHHHTNDIALNGTLSEFLIPTAFNAFEIAANIGGSVVGNYQPVSGLSECTINPPRMTAAPPPCYHRVLTHNGTITAAHPGTTRLVYILVGQDDYGIFSSTQYVIANSANPVTPTNSNTFTCADLPAGKTGTLYVFGLGYEPITTGTCTTPSDTIVDTGSYGTAIGDPWIAGIPFYSGAFQANAFLFNQADALGVVTPGNTITASINQTAPGVLTFNTTALGNGLGIIRAAQFQGTGTGASISTGTASNSDLAGEITLSGGSGSFSFAGTYTNRPECFIHDQTTPANDHTATFVVTNTSITITGSGTDVVGYGCLFRN